VLDAAGDFGFNIVNKSLKHLPVRFFKHFTAG
jgi:hypothetical protein